MHDESVWSTIYHRDNGVMSRYVAGESLVSWEKTPEAIRNITLKPYEACVGCEKRPLCAFCPAFNRIETGSEAGRSNYLCALGHERLTALEPITTSGDRI